MTAEMTAAMAVVKCLEAEGVSVVFGYPGAAICPLYDALLGSGIRHILVRGEAAGGHAANGYARMTGRPAVCLATSGPGATNLLTAIATAFADSVPLIVITGQVSTDQIGRDVFQEVDTTGATAPFVKHSYLVNSADALPEVIAEAFFIAGSGRRGPVLIDIPQDIAERRIAFSSYKTVNSMRSYKPSTKGNALQIKRISEAIAKAERPLICAGGGVFAANSGAAVARLSAVINAPIVTTMMGIGSVTTSIGMLGLYGTARANAAVSACDLLILIGARVGDRAVRSPQFLQESTKIIHIDIDPAEIGKNIIPDIPVVGDCGLILEQLLQVVEPRSGGDFLAQIMAIPPHSPLNPKKAGYVDPRMVVAALSEKLPAGSVLVADVGQGLIWSANFFKVEGGRFLTSGGMGTMGYAIPAAIGAKIAKSEATVVAICGDGAFQMEMAELATICQNHIDVKIILLNNGSLGMIRELQDKVYGGRYAAISLDGAPNFTALAAAFGIAAERVSSPDEIDGALERMLAAKGCFLLECIIDPSERSIED